MTTPKAGYPQLVEDTYVAALRGLVDRMYAAAVPVVERLYSAAIRRVDDLCEDPGARRLDNERELPFTIREAGLALTFGRIVEDPRPTRRAGRSVEGHNRGQHDALMKVVPGVNPLRDEPWTQPMMEAWTRENVRLIKTLPESAFADIERAVSEAWQRGRSTRDLMTALKERQGVTGWKAERIARDQVGKLNGQLTAVRQTASGIERYTWRTSRDARVRQHHAEREGDEYSWAEPPSDGHPGTPILCRCTAEPMLDDLLSDEGLARLGTAEHAAKVERAVNSAVEALGGGRGAEPKAIAAAIRRPGVVPGRGRRTERLPRERRLAGWQRNARALEFPVPVAKAGDIQSPGLKRMLAGKNGPEVKAMAENWWSEPSTEKLGHAEFRRVMGASRQALADVVADIALEQGVPGLDVDLRRPSGRRQLLDLMSGSAPTTASKELARIVSEELPKRIRARAPVAFDGVAFEGATEQWAVDVISRALPPKGSLQARIRHAVALRDSTHPIKSCVANATPAGGVLRVHTTRARVGRSNASWTTGQVELYHRQRTDLPAEHSSVALHEYAHIAEGVNGRLDDASNHFLASRTGAKELPSVLAHDPESLCIRDRFVDAYTGRVYTEKAESPKAVDSASKPDAIVPFQRAHETQTMSVQALANPEMLLRMLTGDSDHVAFGFATLNGWWGWRP